MNTLEIPKGWWLNVTVMAAINPSHWIVGVLRQGKNTWITETVKSDFICSEDAYKWGVEFINRYNK